jgi:hypothetical protein
VGEIKRKYTVMEIQHIRSKSAGICKYVLEKESEFGTGI